MITASGAPASSLTSAITTSPPRDERSQFVSVILFISVLLASAPAIHFNKGQNALIYAPLINQSHF